MRYLTALIILVYLGGLVVAFSGTGDTSPDHDAERKLLMAVNFTCDGNFVNVTENGHPVEGAHVSVKDASTAALLAFGDTDENGMFVFSGCGYKVDMKASKAEYATAIATHTEIGCVQCPGCTVDEDCPSTQYCSAGNCANVSCDCGTVSAHACSAYGCCSDTDCAAGMVCSSHECQNRPVGENSCTKDADCAGNQYCNMPAGTAAPVSGQCTDITGCGYV